MSPSSSGTETVRVAVPLAGYTTLRLGGPASRFVDASTAEELVDAVRECDAAGAPLLVLGGGSNLVIGDDGFPGTVVRVATSGSRVDRIDADTVQWTVEAGVEWDAAVAEVVELGLGGVECLSGIPGLVGATPVQNVGAYGVEVSDLLISVDLFDRLTGEIRTVPAAELGLAYRTSILKGNDRAVVLRARFALHADGRSAPIRYTELARALGAPSGEPVSAAAARAAVLDLRRGKGMVLDADDHDTWSAGSFFTNPLLDNATADVTIARIAELVGADILVPRYPAGDGHSKLSAAWLIERAGFHRGYPGPGGRVGLSTKHTLALTNRGSATAADLVALAADVRDGVRNAFGIDLQPEPLLIGCSL